MPTNSFNTGRDARVVIRHPLAPGGELQLRLLSDFDAKAQWHDIKKSHLDGLTRTQHVPENMMMTFSVDRSDSAIDDFCSAIWGAYRAAGRVPDGSIFVYVSELNGSESTYEYSGVAFKPDDLGSFKKEDSVVQKMSASAMDFRRVA